MCFNLIGLFYQLRPYRVGVIQVGTKPRDGNYGACFYSNPETSDVVVYSARPGCRVWEVSTGSHDAIMRLCDLSGSTQR